MNHNVTFTLTLLAAALLPGVNQAQVAAGKAIYTTYCTPCHGQQGEGTVGPNLTDAYWLHGHTKKDIIHVVTNGVVEKGMMAWKATLNPTQIQQVASYVLSLSGTNPANGKAPQGKKYASAAPKHTKGTPKMASSAPDVVTPVPAAPATPAVVVAPADTTPATGSPADTTQLALGDAGKGKQLFNVMLGCSHCHGINSVGHTDTRNLREIKKRHSAEWEQVFAKVMKEGRTGTAMPPWAHLKPTQVADIKAFISSIQEE